VVLAGARSAPVSIGTPSNPSWPLEADAAPPEPVVELLEALLLEALLLEELLLALEPLLPQPASASSTARVTRIEAGRVLIVATVASTAAAPLRRCTVSG
jgi:hypothetical protein